MTLDLSAVAKLLEGMARDLSALAESEEERLAEALSVLHSRAEDVDMLNERAREPGFGWQAAKLLEPLDRAYPLPKAPVDYTVTATDGSLIEPDRHGTVYYYLLNIGGVTLRYGQNPKADMVSWPTMGYRPEDLFLTLGDREVPLEGGLLRVKRAVAEVVALSEEMRRQDGRPIVGFVDGTLVLWMPEGRFGESDMRKALLPPFLAALSELRKADMVVASYISRPRSAEIVNALRAAVCPYPKADCRTHCPQRSMVHPAPCNRIDGITDRRLLSKLPLLDGERSAMFASQARIVEDYGEHRVYYCYINTGEEMARVEMPEWVAAEPQKVDLVHGLVYEQCRKGNGYPRALTEAHERAVIGVADREQCERMIDVVLARHHFVSRPSQKQQSKRMRGV